MLRLGPVRVVVLCCLGTLVAPPVGRAQQALPLPTPGEAQIGQALADTTELDFDNQPLEKVAEYLKQRHALEIQIDRRALEDAGMGSDTPITRKLKDVSLRSALRLVLDELDLTFVVRDGFLLITTKMEAENMLATKVYPVADLVTTESDFQPPASGMRRRSGYTELLDAINQTIAPDTWENVGGPGVIESFRNGEALVVSQTTEVQEEVAELLAALRKTRDKQRAVAAAIARRPPAEDAVPEMRIKVYRFDPSPQAFGRGMGGGGGGGMGMLDIEDADAEQPPAADPAAAAKPADVADKPEQNSPKPEQPAPQKPHASRPAFDRKQLDAWAAELALLLPQMIEPESWRPRGEGVARAAVGAIIVRQTDEIHEEVARLLGQIVSFHVARDFNADSSREIPLPPLATPGPQVNWPQEAEPSPEGRGAEIEQALDGPAEFDLNDEPLANLVEMLGERYGIQALLHRRALEDAGMGSDTPLTRQIHGISLRGGLKLLLRELDLTYVIRDEVLLITTKAEAENMLAARVYPVFDLVVRSGEGGRERAELNYRSLIDVIQSAIAPGTWEDVGGPGAIEPLANAGAVVISQTTEVHEEIAQHLRALRDAAAQQAVER